MTDVLCRDVSRLAMSKSNLIRVTLVGWFDWQLNGTANCKARGLRS
jgi:hypothetical protein